MPSINAMRKQLQRVLLPHLEQHNHRLWCTMEEHSGERGVHRSYKCIYCERVALSGWAHDTGAYVHKHTGAHSYCRKQMFNIRCEFADFIGETVQATLADTQRALAWKKCELEREKKCELPTSTS